MTIQDLAGEASAAFVRKRRSSSKKAIWCTKDEHHKEPSENRCWICRMIWHAHSEGEYLPDDWRYEFIVEALAAFSDHDDPESAIDNIEPDVYNSELLAWLSSNLNRSGYCDEVMHEYPGHDLMATIGLGQAAEKREVYQLVLEALQERLEELEEAEEAAEEAEEAAEAAEAEEGAT